VSNKKGVCFENLEKENGDDEGVEEDLRVGKIGFQPMWNFDIYSWKNGQGFHERCQKKGALKF